jgi:queuine tRNA-ribosyltransferase
MGFFNVLSNSSECKARTGTIKTSHGVIETPVFMPIGTLGAVKALLPKDLNEFSAKIILSNTYHLFLRPGTEVISKAGGLHKFVNWNNSILTDSGGFQVFSLSALRKVKEHGVEFSSHIDGSRHLFTPEKVIEIQRILGSDIMMPLDECLPNPTEKKAAEKSLELTTRWEKTAFDSFINSSSRYKHKQFLFAICQGSTYKDLRKIHIEAMSELDFDGYAIGGLAVGEKVNVMYDLVDYSTDFIAKKKPRYLMGVGTPVDLLECVEKGVDMFDCVLPTRNARHGRLYTTYGEINLKNADFKNNFDTPDSECHTYTSENFSLSFLRHLFMSKEILGMQLATLHNIGFYMKLMADIRDAIKKDRFMEFKKHFINNFKSK